MCQSLLFCSLCVNPFFSLCVVFVCFILFHKQFFNEKRRTHKGRTSFWEDFLQNLSIERINDILNGQELLNILWLLLFRDNLLSNKKRVLKDVREWKNTETFSYILFYGVWWFFFVLLQWRNLLLFFYSFFLFFYCLDRRLFKVFPFKSFNVLCVIPRMLVG